jgi:hypothetical protein
MKSLSLFNPLIFSAAERRPSNIAISCKIVPEGVGGQIAKAILCAKNFVSCMALFYGAFIIPSLYEAFYGDSHNPPNISLLNSDMHTAFFR